MNKSMIGVLIAVLVVAGGVTFALVSGDDTPDSDTTSEAASDEAMEHEDSTDGAAMEEDEAMEHEDSTDAAMEHDAAMDAEEAAN